MNWIRYHIEKLFDDEISMWFFQKGEIGSSLPLSHLLGDGHLASVVKNLELPSNEDEDEVWLGEPTAHLNHVVAYHQFVREQMQAMLQDQHKTVNNIVVQNWCMLLSIAFDASLEWVLSRAEFSNLQTGGHERQNSQQCLIKFLTIVCKTKGPLFIEQ